MNPEDYAKLLDRLAPDDLLRAAKQAGGIRLWTDDDRKWAKGTLIHEYRERQQHLAMGWKYCPAPQKMPEQMVETAKALIRFRGGQP